MMCNSGLAVHFSVSMTYFKKLFMNSLSQLPPLLNIAKRCGGRNLSNH